MVGSIIDLSSIYYNPGTLALQRNPAVILGTKAFELQTITFAVETCRLANPIPLGHSLLFGTQEEPHNVALLSGGHVGAKH